jgi:N-methylhydantoinase B
MSNLPVETIEARYPLLMEEYSLRQDSGGAGRYRGGMGLIRQYRLLADSAVLQLRADRHQHPPYGLFGGKAAASSRNSVMRDGVWQTLPAKTTLEISRNTVVRHEQAGGGGWGEPAQRAAEAIRADLRNGKISAERALADYGYRGD